MIEIAPNRPLLTARKVCEVVEGKLGIPLRRSRLHKDSALGKGPRPAARFGKQFLYDELEALRYGKSLISSPEAA
jgi:hypothetical protein